MSNDPYAAPEADLSVQTETIQTSPWNARGRLARLAYLAQNVVLSLLMVIPMIFGFGSLLGLSGLDPNNMDLESAMSSGSMVAIAIMVVVGLVGVYLSACLLIKRLHDRGMSGWWGLLVIIPFLGSLIWLFYALMPGKPESNRFGGPRANKGWEKILGWVGLIFMVGSILFTFSSPFAPDLY